MVFFLLHPKITLGCLRYTKLKWCWKGVKAEGEEPAAAAATATRTEWRPSTINHQPRTSVSRHPQVSLKSHQISPTRGARGEDTREWCGGRCVWTSDSVWWLNSLFLSGHRILWPFSRFFWIPPFFWTLSVFVKGLREMAAAPQGDTNQIHSIQASPPPICRLSLLPKTLLPRLYDARERPWIYIYVYKYI